MLLPLAKPPWNQLGKRIESACRKALYDFSLIEDEKIGLALSGGKDSLALLYMLKAISGRGMHRFNIIAFHVEGAFSCGPGIAGNYLSAICEALGVPLVICKGEQKPLAELECYSCSRARRKLIFDAARKEGIRSVAFGHHMDDQVQTLLLNLFHKGEFEGMLPKVPMVRYSITIIRPLIYVSEKEIFEFAKAYNFARISCQCPIGQCSKRKEVDGLLKEMEVMFPHVRSNLSKAALVYGSKKALTVS